MVRAGYLKPMLKLELRHIDAIISSGLAGDLNPGISEDERHDLALDALSNDAPVFSSKEAEQDKGAYSVVIRGVPGAYFVQANEYDDAGVFDSLDEAESYMWLNFGEFIVDND